MRVLSLFDGISCGRVALDRAGIPVETYYASEIHQPSITVAQKNYPSTIQLGDVTKVDGTQLGEIDLLIGGSPCFRAGTLITTDKGYKKIEDIQKGDMVLTHMNRFREVVAPMVTLSNRIYALHIQGRAVTHVTEDHPYYVRRLTFVKDKETGEYAKVFTEPEWKAVKDITDGDLIGSTIDEDILKQDDLIIIGSFVWLPFRKKELLDLADTVYNFEVAEDNSYVANNCIVHNCQGFSFAGKQLNFEDPRSKLFFEYVRILEEVKPKYFLLENVVMKKEYQDIISKYLGIEPVMIDSALVSAQRRKRLYWTNIPDLTQPRDKGILLKDIVHENADLDTIMGDSWVKWFTERADYLLSKKYVAINPDKAITLTARQYANWNGNFVMECLKEYIVPFDTTLRVLDKEVQSGKMGYFRKDSQANRVYYLNNKAVTLCGDAGGGAAKMGQYLFGEVKENYFQYDLHGKGHGSQDQRAYYPEGKHGTLPSRGASSKCKVLFGEVTPDAIIPGEPIEGIVDGQKFYTLTNKENRGVLIEGYIRKLTPIECVPGDTYIMGSGKEIQDISIGDTVITPTGEQTVAHKFINDFDGELFKVKVQGCLPFKITSEHPVLVASRQGKRGLNLTEPEWKNPCDLVEKHDFMLIPRVAGFIQTESINLSEYVKDYNNYSHIKNRITMGLPTEVALDETFCYLIGIMVAEASYRKETVEISFGAHETELIQDVISKLNSLGFNCSTTHQESVTKVIVYSVTLMRFLREQIGYLAHNKKIPDIILYNKDERKVRWFLEGYFDGDGHRRLTSTGSEKQECTTVSRDLAYAIQVALARLGVFSSIYKSNPSKQIMGRDVNARERYHVVYVTKNKYNVRYKVYEKYIAVPIQKIEREVYKGRVYNIETTDNLYLVSNLVVHNCERLQTLPDNYTEGISNAQRYAALGNGWTVDVIAHILKHIIV